jgi:DNA (cytosine-5)-methyltransferase 1
LSRLAQPFLPWVQDELVIDCFAGGGGASSGIEQALGRPVDLAINHDAAAIAMHEANHPSTRHLISDVWEVDPREATGGRTVAFAWFSPDCQHFSKARGGKPIRTTKRRSLAWVVTRWAGTVRPRVIMLENVEEFQQWGPLVGPSHNLRPCKRRKGRTFRKWVGTLRKLGYKVEWRELKACDYGAPTIRKRLYMIARCDGQPIVWPEPTHGPGRANPYRTAAECIDWGIPMLSIFASKEEAANWSKERGIPRPIRPLADNTMRRIARGVKRFVLDNPKPFLVTLAHADVSPSGVKRWGKSDRSLDDPLGTVQCSQDQGLVAPMISPITHEGDRSTPPADQPLATITTANRGEQALVAPYLVPRYGEREGQEPRVRSVEDPAPVIVPDGNGGSLVAANLATYHQEGDGKARGANLDQPIHTIDCANRHGLVASFLAQNNGGFFDGEGRKLEDPLSTVLTQSRGHHGLIAVNLIEQHGTAHAEDVEKPLQTISAGGTHHGVVATHIQRDFGQSVGSPTDAPIGTLTGTGNGKAGLVASFLQTYYGQGIGQTPDDPMRTIPTVDRFGFVTVSIDGEPHYISDIAMRMLQPRELYLAQGFRQGYVIDRGVDGTKLTKTEQVRMVGNSVSPPVAEALARANCPEMVAKVRRAA